MTNTQRYHLRQWTKDVLTKRWPLSDWPNEPAGGFLWRFAFSFFIIMAWMNVQDPFSYIREHRMIEQNKPNLLTMQRCREQQVLTRSRYEVKIEAPYDEKDVEAMVKIAMRESSLNHLAKNPDSTAFGLFQLLDSTHRNYGVKSKDPLVQTKSALKYVDERYGGPAEAWASWQRNGWY